LILATTSAPIWIFARQALGLEVMLSQAKIAGYGYAAHETAEVLLRAKANIDDLTDEQVEILLVKNLEISRGQQAGCRELRAACDLASLWQSKGRSFGDQKRSAAA
jgi:hypothetical protein